MTMPFDTANIRIDRPPMSIHQIMRKIERGWVELNPDFQRNFLWDHQRQSLLIESILLRVPLPTFYVDATVDEHWQVIDGLQRLSTLHAFINKGTLRLQGLEVLPELNGKTFAELTVQLQETINDTALTIIAVEAGTPRDVKFLIFRRINTGGINLNDQEVRHAIFGGPAREFLRDLANSDAFLNATQGLVDSSRMEDRECVLRFVAFHLNPYDTVLKPGSLASSIDTLLNQTMEELNSATAPMREQYAETLTSSLEKAHTIFGDLAFRAINELQATGPFRKTLFEAWTVGLRALDAQRAAQPTIRERIIRDSIEQMTNNTQFFASIQSGADDEQSIVTRFGTIEQLLKKYI